MLMAVFFVPALFIQFGASASSTLTRSDQPLVLTGAQIGALQGIAPGDLVAFSYGTPGWEQIPVQVDERHTTNIRNAYPNPMSSPCGDPCYTPGTRVVNQLVYSDAKTLIAADPDTSLDVNDEVALMVKDAGGIAPESVSPAGVVGDGVEIKVSDPIDGGVGYVYLFRRDAGASSPLDPAAGKSYVEYVWQVNHIGSAVTTAANYKTQYRFNGHNGSSYVGNPENSWVETAHYRREMTGRWHDNVLINKRGVAEPVNIVQRHDASITLDQGGIRNQNTFDVGEMAYITSKAGPIRAIRDYLGTNSGPLTQRRHIFYESHEQITINLRVHAIPGASDVWNYNTNAVGMRSATFLGSDRIDGGGGSYAGGLVILPNSWNWETIDRDTTSDPARGGITFTVYYNSNNPDPVAHHIYRDNGSGGSPSAPYRGGTLNQGPLALVDTDATSSGPNAIFLTLIRNIHYEETGATDGPGRLAQDTTAFQTLTTNR